jgi:hypothetical protein
MRLDWSEIHQVRGYFTVSAKKAKTARRRLIPIANNLAQYLRPYAGMIGLVWPKGGRVYHKAINQLRSEIGMPYWPQNALRHSFASYHLAKHCNASELMLYMGHTSTKQIFEAYRELCFRKRPRVIGTSCLLNMRLLFALRWPSEPQRSSIIQRQKIRDFHLTAFASVFWEMPGNLLAHISPCWVIAVQTELVFGSRSSKTFRI